MSVLGPALGHLADPPRDVPHEALRLALLDRVLAAAADRRLDGAAWVEAWRVTAEALTAAVMAEATALVEAAATASRYPAARGRALLPDDETTDILRQRLLALALPLEALAAAPITDDLTRRRGAALEAAWLAAQPMAAADLARWHAIAREVASWRRPLRPILVAGIAALVVVAVMATWLGGWVPAPAWFAPVTRWFWSFPWP